MRCARKSVGRLTDNLNRRPYGCPFYNKKVVREVSMGIIPFKQPPCPKCCNRETYTSLVVPLPDDASDDYTCECGKCGHRYSVALERRVWLAMPPVSDPNQHI